MNVYLRGDVRFIGYSPNIHQPAAANYIGNDIHGS